MGWKSSSLRIRLTRNEILSFAKKYLSLSSYEAGVSNGEADERLERIQGAARRRGYMTCDDLLAVATWKWCGLRLENLIKKNRPDDCAVLDKRVTRTIQGPCSYDFDSWIQIAKFCRTKSDEFGVTMRELDRALWTYDGNSKEKK